MHSSEYKSIELNGKVLFDRAAEGRFPDVNEVEHLIRDNIVPNKDLGHSDLHAEVGSAPEDQYDEVDDDEAAAEARRYFGVI